MRRWVRHLLVAAILVAFVAFFGFEPVCVPCTDVIASGKTLYPPDGYQWELLPDGVARARR